MIIEVPFIYTARVVPPRARNERAVEVIDTMPLNIRELTADEFPLVAEYLERFADIHDKGYEHIHSDGHRFFKAIGGLIPAGLEAMAQAGGPSPFQHHQRLWTAAPDARQRHGAIEGRVISDNRQERVAKLLEVGRRVVASEGVLFEGCGEPVWRRRPGWVFEAVICTPELLESEPSLLFRADRLKDEIDARNEAAGRNEQPDLWGDIRVHRPDLLRLSVEAVALLKEANRQLGYLAEDIGRRVAETSVETFTAYATARDILAGAQKAEVTEDVVEAVRLLIEIRSRSGLGNSLSEAYERWRLEVTRGMELPDGTEALKTIR